VLPLLFHLIVHWTCAGGAGGAGGVDDGDDGWWWEWFSLVVMYWF